MENQGSTYCTECNRPLLGGACICGKCETGPTKILSIRAMKKLTKLKANKMGDITLERSELSYKIAKLFVFLQTDRYNSLHLTQQDIITTQLNIMEEYLAILDIRIKLFT